MVKFREEIIKTTTFFSFFYFLYQILIFSDQFKLPQGPDYIVLKIKKKLKMEGLGIGTILWKKKI